MARALQLARNGRLDASPNPMVGAVIVTPDGRIIGEGWHRQVGHGHAEVNAVASVKPSDRHLLREATMHVTLEPCSHYGRTPPCSKLIIDSGIPRVVVAMTDPFPAVSGRGVAMLREAGVEVVTGVMEAEARALNRRFILAHTLGRPMVTLKWAMSADGFMDCRRDAGTLACRFSTPLSLAAVHRLRACHDAILVGAGTAIADNPSLDTRLWPGSRAPKRVLVDRRGRVPASARLFSEPGCICFTSAVRADLPECVEQVIVAPDAGPHDIVAALMERGITSVLVEGGAEMLKAFIGAGLADNIRVEQARFVLGAEGTAPAPKLG
ncbi:MAG: bifunctional diaminohydroxyphosphoribosylaminopyrimidine deaminase/5-amino-6-(5-phosphoribosylamino)uracil reductase RibD [Candidatus Amulumruptor sp.]|nr:bifunctional diaminohydroxyphosphoribosylaminopyrimidine deaminase/5-amino-6-(5-phosphoribosylamino)uracil reductase RibD [Candidatus Amulumruptor sp.]MDE7237577.1 bifunctional diaminohydroxyphosphoribosylaminopyrimidine deaminase/5-amino-6-(5-phosphoribosylamino)uracil reductase RibD [Paramuribaculum sp.]